ncbi:xanthine dehydrogenase family protein molybdopterin-binding subunit [Irregularibacter muris]|uniref:Xanthine dehydrogenase family protein molybdopterin-binding subunit n=1 Tax=Irregularibacter muris TaxID=1796619 RepID=A0AAE3HIT6_9FIRM|nr:xanthine dehydrogenase family protein molybdopterin-binding subunit [Irregularibacter muris]MCR1900125.1 xanthine dehydrogenase family protein molybdopterin-binding subunit [Irregularibacter muris]
MRHTPQIGVSSTRKDAWDKVTGNAKYTGDTVPQDILHARIVTSPHAHALIKNIDTSKAENYKGVKAVITGKYFSVLTGSMITDRPPIAKDKVRYYGEAVALIVADSEENAMAATQLVEVEYQPLPVVNSIQDAIKQGATLIHENLGEYFCPDSGVSPLAHSNICDHIKIRKGNAPYDWSQCDNLIEYNFSMPSSDHLAMETRNASSSISPDGIVNIHTSTQAPFAVKEEIAKAYGIDEGKIVVHTPLVGGAFGGKATVSIEFLAFLASHAVKGRMVRIANSREQDMNSTPSKLGAEGKIRLGATKEGKIKALECIYYTSCGAYSDTGPRMAKAIATDCSGPYNIENIHCDSHAVYTNHSYATSFRGFGHSVSTFGIEMAMNKLAQELNIDPLELRRMNAIKPGDLSPTQDKITLSNTGDLEKCITKGKEILNWDKNKKIRKKKGMIRTIGVSCFWKTSSSPPSATSGVVLTLNTDGTINLNFGATEIGPGMKTTMAQILAEKMKMKVEQIYVYMDVNTQISPKHWKTVASMTTFMVGNAVIDAAEDLIRQIKEVSSIVLRCNPESLDVQEKRVFLKKNPDVFVEFKDIVHGYQYPNQSSVYGQLIGRGNYIMERLIPLDKETGKGKSGVSWTVGVQAVEIEYDPKLYTYRLLRAVTVADIGKVINPKMARGVVMGGMSMGLGLATREEFLYGDSGTLENTSLRTYKVMHFGEQPQYEVEFIETPQIDAPFGARGIGEDGILGIPSAFAHAISKAAEEDFHQLPISPENIWKSKTGGRYDTL